MLSLAYARGSPARAQPRLGARIPRAGAASLVRAVLARGRNLARARAAKLRGASPPSLQSSGNAAPHLDQVGAHGPGGGAHPVHRLRMVRRRRDGGPAVGHGPLLPVEYLGRHGRASRQRDPRAPLRHRALDQYHAADRMDDRRLRRRRGGFRGHSQERFRPVHPGRPGVRLDPGDRCQGPARGLEHQGGRRPAVLGQHVGRAGCVRLFEGALVPALDGGPGRPRRSPRIAAPAAPRARSGDASGELPHRLRGAGAQADRSRCDRGRRVRIDELGTHPSQDPQTAAAATPGHRLARHLSQLLCLAVDVGCEHDHRSPQVAISI